MYKQIHRLFWLIFMIPTFPGFMFLDYCYIRYTIKEPVNVKYLFSKYVQLVKDIWNDKI